MFQLDKNNQMKCLIKNCSSNLKSTDTFNLFRHLEKIHPDNTKIFLHLLRTKPKTMIFNKNKTQIVTDQKIKKTIFVSMLILEYHDYLLMMVLRGVSFSFFESEGFRLLTRQINKSLNFYTNRHNLKTIINNKYNELKNEISNIYKDKLINISIDGAVREHRKFLGVNAHIIHDGQFHTLNLGIVELY